jgi:hypothetical protein
MKYFQFFTVTIWLVGAALAQDCGAQEETSKTIESTEPPSQAIEISGTKDPDGKRYRAMLKGLNAFDKYHSLAPNATHKYILRPRQEGVELQGVSLRLAYNDMSLPIPIAEDGTFSLPRDEQAQQQDAELLINRKKSLFRWWPHIRSPGLQANQRRLGDLRIECQIFWAVYYDDIPFVARNLVSAIGGPCTTSKVLLSFPADFRGLESATLVDGERNIKLNIDEKQSGFAVPLADKSLNDDALIELHYKEQADSIRIRNYAGMSASVKL